jgi:hypothetical protein
LLIYAQFLSVEPLIVEHVISVADKPNTAIECTLLSVQQKRDIKNKMDGISNFPHKRTA